MLRTCCLFVCLLAGSYQLTIKDFVVPESVEAGSDVTLKCGFDLDATDGKAVPYVKWWFIPRYGSDDKRVQLYQRMQPGIDPDLHHGIESAGNYDIIVKNVTHRESGKYECEVTGAHERRVNQSLTVFSKGTGPQLNISEVKDGADADDEEDLLLECHADDVSPQPELVLYSNGRPVDGVAQYESNEGDGLFSVTANVTVTKADMLGVLVKCELLYADHTVSHPPFVDEETYSSDSSRRSFSWCLSVAALLIPLQLRTLV